MHGRGRWWRRLGAGCVARIYTTAEATRVWHIRESGLGATAFVPGQGTGWEGWEDAAVDPTQLGSYLRAIFALMQEYGYRSPMYGHFGQGCVHMRHNFDLETEPGIRAFRSFMERAADVALAHGGSLSGEHGDGQARGALLPKMFGPELMEAFREFKRIWDPGNRMNPGKLIDAHEPHEDLRLGADYKPWEPETHFALVEDGGSLAAAALRCVGVGACRKTDAGTMCPSFMATGEELHSTRGRAHLLWELMQGEVLEGGWAERAGEGVAGPLFELQGVQERVSGECGHGDVQGGVSGAPLCGEAAGRWRITRLGGLIVGRGWLPLCPAWRMVWRGWGGSRRR